MTGPASLLQVEGLTKVFGAGRTEVLAVDGVSFATGAGEITLVMGPSGSGKTTLLTMIGGLLRPSSGCVVIEGVEITALPSRELPRVRRESVGFVFQTFNLLESLTALENVEVALNVAGVKGLQARTRATDLLVAAGLESRLGFQARDLSGGEKQRVSIARALANRPALLLADEPTANLDSVTGGQILDLMKEMNAREKTTFIFSTHDANVLKYAKTAVKIKDGIIAEKVVL